MEPINQKERTTAFIQFMVMFVIAIILVLCLAFMDYTFCHDDYVDLKKQLKERQMQDSKLPSNLSFQVDSVYNFILGLTAKNETDFGELRDNNIALLKKEWIDSKNQTLNPEEFALKNNMITVFTSWMNSKKSIVSYGEKGDKIESLKVTIDELQQKKLSLESQLRECQSTK